MKLTLDASVHLEALSSHEVGSAASRELVELLHAPAPDGAAQPYEVFSPTLMLVELASAVARTLDDEEAGNALAGTLRYLPAQTMIPLSTLLAEATSRLAARLGLPSSVAIYGAVAQLYGSTLVTRDADQREQLGRHFEVWSPEEALDRLRRR